MVWLLFGGHSGGWMDKQCPLKSGHCLQRPVWWIRLLKDSALVRQSLSTKIVSSDICGACSIFQGGCGSYHKYPVGFDFWFLQPVLRWKHAAEDPGGEWYQWCQSYALPHPVQAAAHLRFGKSRISQFLSLRRIYNAVHVLYPAYPELLHRRAWASSFCLT